MLRVGLTGGIGAGKSTVARHLAALGAVVVDADVVAREVVGAGTEGLAAVAAEFGTGVLAADGTLDRAALGALVFGDDDARSRLEGLLHPRIAARTEELVRRAPDDAVLVHDVPLLVEKGMGAGYHLVLVVDVPVDVRVGRLLRDRGMDASQARGRIAAQADDDARRAAADVLLDNSGEPGAVLDTVTTVWRDRLVPFEVNLRQGRPAVRPEPPQVVPADPTWPAQAARVVARVRHALGPAARAVEHVGPTATGRDAVDVLDVEVLLEAARPDDATAEGARARLDRAGFVRRDGSPVHRSADPGRPVDVRLVTARRPGDDGTGDDGTGAGGGASARA